MASAGGAAWARALLTRSNAVRNPVGTSVGDLDTPALVIDLDAVDRNMAVMKAYAADRGLLLRPHAKLHKSAEIARLLMREGGAVGVCVQKLGEAQAMVAGGVQDVFISNEIVHPAKLAGVAKVAQALAAMPVEHRATPAEPKLTICCDCPEGVHLLAKALEAEGGDMVRVGVFVELEVGQGRCGAVPAGPRAMATVEAVLGYEKASGAPSRLYYAGIHAYNGATQHVRTFDRRKAEIHKVVEGAVAMRDAVKSQLRADTPLITGAGTGTFTLEAESGVFGELQPGSYLVMDRDYAENEPDARHPSFEHALFVTSRVMSFGATPGAVVVDAGHKSHAIDTGMPTVFGRPDVEVLNRGDEHAIIAPKAAGGDCGLGLNDIVHLVPGHCDPTFNLHDEAVGIRGGMKDGKVERIIAIDARGCGY